jgi:hypothetical protein
MASSKVEKKNSSPLAIAVLDRGWVFVGRVTESPSALVLEHAACIRRWGTTKGIGQLALQGPHSGTVMDEAGNVTVPRTALILLIEAAEDKWPGR